MESTYLILISGKEYIVRDSDANLRAMFKALRSHNVKYEYRGFHDFLGKTLNVIQFLDSLLMGDKSPDNGEA